ncbi:hypothetical protein [Streptomyces sp. NBC_00893]|uniref:hypothetical protein n=1 Tax=Streptomyces sp. NBC_00893 TaxID=2975862 RepID=UPI00225A4191|nr:hypothetical protein [Streptomyces sp. NBC_00893]MCX4851882.1 hypothetical protein [Streptomyces sp. NBC_00893]
MTTTVPASVIDKNLDDGCASVTAEIIGVRAGSYRLLVSPNTACQQAEAGLPLRRSMV